MNNKTAKSEVPEETRRLWLYEAEMRDIEQQCAQLPIEEALKLRCDRANERARAAADRLQHAITEALFHKEEAETALAIFATATGAPKKDIKRI